MFMLLSFFKNMNTNIRIEAVSMLCHTIPVFVETILSIQQSLSRSSSSSSIDAVSADVFLDLLSFFILKVRLFRSSLVVFSVLSCECSFCCM